MKYSTAATHRVLAAVMVLICVIPTVSLYGQSGQSLGTKARIEEKGNLWVLDKGSSHGVVQGQEGFLMKKTFSPKEKKFINEKVAHFNINKVFQYFSYAQVDRWTSGYSSRDAQWAQFTRRLVAPPRQGTAPKKAPAKTPGVESGKSTRWYLDQGDKAFDVKRYDKAIEYYEEVLDRDPNDPGAKLRIREARRRHFVQQGNLDYKGGLYVSAYEYFMMAFQMKGDDDIVAAEKILALWEKDRTFYDKTREFEISPGDIIGALITRCETLLAEKQLDQLAAMARRVLPFAEDEALKNKLDTFTAAQEIQNDLAVENFSGLLSTTEGALRNNNVHKAGFIIVKLESAALNNIDTKRLLKLKEKLKSKTTEMEIRQALARLDIRIRELEKNAESFVALNKYDEAIKLYMEMYKLAPERKEFGNKIAELQAQKFNYVKLQADIKARVDRDNFILYAQDYHRKQLMQDALDYYVRAYKVFPEEGAAVAGIARVLEECGAADARIVTPELLDRKFTKFVSDFLSYVEKNYLGDKFEQGLAVMEKLTFITKSKQYDELMMRMKDRIHDKRLDFGDTHFRMADFERAQGMYREAMKFKKSPRARNMARICAELLDIRRYLLEGNKRGLTEMMGLLRGYVASYKHKVLEGMLNLSEHLMKEGDFRNARTLYKKVADFKVAKFKSLIEALKVKEKTLKQKR